MIDFESEIFTKTSASVRTTYPNALIVSEDIVSMPEKFPCISIIEIDNQSFLDSRDSGSTENHARVTYEVNVYSNLKTKKKTQCKTIMGLIDSKFIDLGFTRTSKSPVTMGGSDLCRMVTRYQAIISKDGQIYRI